MKRFVIGTVVFLLVLVAWSSLAAYPLWRLLEAFGGGDTQFRRVFSRTLMVGAFLLLVPLCRYWGVRGWAVIGCRWPQGAGREVAISFLSGVVLVALLAVWSGIWGWRSWHPEFEIGRAFGHLLTGWSIGLFEEILFRGLFFLAVLAFTPRSAWPWVAVLGSLVFAAVHFFIDVHPARETPHWGSGWAMWVQWAQTLMEPQQIYRRGLSLFMAGLVLCAMAWRTGHIWSAVALHAGWVFAIKTVHRLSDHADGKTIWFSGDLLGGLWAVVFLALYLAYLLISRKQKPDESLDRSAG